MSNQADFLAHGDEVRLFPVVSDSSREQRIISIFLGVLTQVPALAGEILGTVGVRVGKRTHIQAFTEVELNTEIDSPCRPDGLIIVTTGRSQWTAILEAKIGKSRLDPSQIERYLKLARANELDAVITISNDFVARVDHSPIAPSITHLRQLTGKVGLYHWSWASLATHCEVVFYQEKIDNSVQLFLLDQLNRYLNHHSTGVERFTQMGVQWKDVVQGVASGAPLTKSTNGIEEVVANWLAEERDLCLHMTSYLGLRVSAKISRDHAADPKRRLAHGIAALVKSQALHSTLRVPDCASDIQVRADLRGRTISVSMDVKARTDRKSSRARINWLLSMLKKDDTRLRVNARWPGRISSTSADLASLRNDLSLLQPDNTAALPHSFEVLIAEDLSARRFSGPKAFIEDLERIVHEFYDLVGTTLKDWRPPPPRPVSQEAVSSDGKGSQTVSLSEDQANEPDSGETAPTT